jgi:hypothetical protein
MSGSFSAQEQRWIIGVFFVMCQAGKRQSFHSTALVAESCNTLYPRAVEAGGGAEKFEVVGAVGEVAGVQLIGTEVFAVAEGG